jgi:hypothetical protein
LKFVIIIDLGVTYGRAIRYIPDQQKLRQKPCFSKSEDTAAIPNAIPTD